MYVAVWDGSVGVFFLFKLIFVMMVFFFNLIYKHGGLEVGVGNWDELCRSMGIFFIVYRSTVDCGVG